MIFSFRNLKHIAPAATLLALLPLTAASPAGAQEDKPAIVEKNLFSPERKPPSAGAVVDQKALAVAKEEPVSLQLDGVFIYGDSKTALVRVKSQSGPGQGSHGKNEGSPYAKVSEGDRVGDYLVVKIEPRSITVERNGERSEVRLFSANKISPPVQIVPAANVPTAGAGTPTQAPPANNGAPGATPKAPIPHQGQGAVQPASPNVPANAPPANVNSPGEANVEPPPALSQGQPANAGAPQQAGGETGGAAPRGTAEAPL